MVRVRSVCAVAVLAAAATVAPAQMYSPGYGTYGAPMSNFLASSYLVQQVANGARSAGTRASKPANVSAGEPAPLRIAPKSPPIAPRSLAATYPPRSRVEAQALFLKTLEGYHAIEAKFGIPRYDMAGALAAFVAGNYVAYHDEPFPDQHFLPLVKQMRGAMGQVGALRSASDADKQELFEQLAILGTYMALAREGLRQQPNPALAANLKNAARHYLEQVMNIDPARMRLTASGLVLN